jgi:hypothetical protein
VTELGGQPALETAWNKQYVWSRTANALKSKLNRARVAALSLTIAGAVLTTTAEQLANGRSTTATALAVVGAVAVGAAPLALGLANSTAVRDWTRARAVSESLKAETYTYAAGVAPYRGPNRAIELVERVAKVSQMAEDLLRYAPRVKAVSRELPAVRDVSTYIEHRVDAQIKWYRDKARRLQTRLAVIRWVGVALVILAVVLFAVVLEVGVAAAAAWVPTIATVAAAVAAYAALRIPVGRIPAHRRCTRVDANAAGNL